eukprot:TRINITY_DN12969_c0_g1_i5.p1 TRINITY_DN12969_c0_g1~~TRINITY_DN12969_c0_g1_i5.p1  ORF type:complete len:147 (-),score=4.86 TRINITY_DN12969_c0_g1_i5:372-812(-)
MASILEVRTQEEPSQYDSVSEAPSSLVSRQDWGSMTKGMKEIFSNLVGIRNKLQKIYHRQKPHTAEDIHKYQQMLDAIDSKREYGIFAGSLETGQIPPGQAACREVSCFIHWAGHRIRLLQVSSDTRFASTTHRSNPSSFNLYLSF